VANGLDQLLDHIARQYLVRDELRTIDLDASAADPGDQLETEKREAAAREIERTRELRGPFAAGLRRALEARSAGEATLDLDDRVPEQDRMAEALIHTLVRTNLATSHADETDENHYIYRLSIDWDALRAVASDAGVDLDEALR
jgi:hypothetical protein